MNDLIYKLRELADDPSYENTFEYMANRQRHTDWSKNVIHKLLNSRKQLYYTNRAKGKGLVRLLTDLEKLGIGYHLGPNYYWNYTVMSVGLAALDKGNELVEVDDRIKRNRPDKEGNFPLSNHSIHSTVDEEEVIQHTFPFRPDKTLPVIIPKDMTAEEKERLIYFIKSLPVSDKGTDG